MTLRGYIENGETMFDAIARVSVLAGQNGCTDYEIRCRVCDWPYEKHERGGYQCACTIEVERKAAARP
jgi:hypothetical protein